MKFAFRPRFSKNMTLSIWACLVWAVAGTAGQTGTDSALGPIADFDGARALPPEVQQRIAEKSPRFEETPMGPIAELPPGAELKAPAAHWYWKVPAIPTQSSDLVIVGTVNKAEAFISSNRLAVFSEFTTHVDQVLKNTSGLSISPGDTLILDRDVGGIRFPDGRVQYYGPLGKGAPVAHKQYLLFLRYDAQTASFFILTGYEFDGGKAYAIDGKRGRGGLRRPYDEYDGQPSKTLIQDALKDEGAHAK